MSRSVDGACYMMRLYPDKDAYHAFCVKHGTVGLALLPIVVVLIIVGAYHPGFLLGALVAFLGGFAVSEVLTWVTWRRDWDQVKRHPIGYENGYLTWKDLWYRLDDKVLSVDVSVGSVQIRRAGIRDEITGIPTGHFDPYVLHLFVHEVVVRYALRFKEDSVVRIQRFDSERDGKRAPRVAGARSAESSVLILGPRRA